MSSPVKRNSSTPFSTAVNSFPWRMGIWRLRSEHSGPPGQRWYMETIGLQPPIIFVLGSSQTSDHCWRSDRVSVASLGKHKSEAWNCGKDPSRICIP
ncbi:hypothetical protein MPTK1_1g23770 [Marchantia polymorpha subsp. ruderalis]|uniref:Uncharacterized protein n=2 Tax=Marchantia polymorpha TaxID=3197 RepID=A0AAF6ATL1_MARPO|nr:hypothetical protein MARPO_0917s0001 [Marchantia polymorpha]BBM99781.1 hypothetical protein Mp_1g23770 [Marchantia polymorpha subsp. ruderalis]|eukprot:PTQ26584.1 hypothetical protein MARPO_0917s0001 [Marchantia polymorpha]